MQDIPKYMKKNTFWNKEIHTIPLCFHKVVQFWEI